ncbi:ABC transporter permease [Defluviitalea saccharophila]|uniref:Autoinducer 2 import system permease protein LsrD n=1 Tax=Defluviitalea saccharophila TaxID=879970 RepID=A0ABZ2Y128_9FIRM|nr:ABC transporter permease [Candidatus Epulonipiscium sp.]
MANQKNKLIITLMENMPIVLFVTIFIIFGILSPSFFSYKNMENIATSASYIGITAVGMTFVLLTAGIDLSVGATMYLSAAVAGLLIQNYHFPVWLALFIGVCVGAVMGMINSFVIIKLKILPFITTLSTMVAGRGVALLMTKSQSIMLPESVMKIGYARVLGIPLPIIFFAIIVLASHILLKRTPLGRQIYAVGNDIEAAKKAGINTTKVLAIVYIICGVLAAIGGIISVAQMGIVNAGFGESSEFDAISASILGGTSMFGGLGAVFPGTVIGTVLIQMIQAGLVYLKVDLYIQPMISAGIIFIAVLLDSIRTTQITKLQRRNIRNENL